MKLNADKSIMVKFLSLCAAGVFLFSPTPSFAADRGVWTPPGYGSDTASKKESVELPILMEESEESAEEAAPVTASPTPVPPPAYVLPPPAPAVIKHKPPTPTVKKMPATAPVPAPTPVAKTPALPVPAPARTSPPAAKPSASALAAVVDPAKKETALAYRARATALTAKGDLDAAEEQLRSAVRLDPTNADIVLDLARVLMDQGKEESALAVLSAYSGADPRVTQALGEAYVTTNQLKEAEQVFMELSLRQPAESYHRYNLGLVESRMEKYDMAENAYVRAVELDPKFSDARYNLALIYIRNRDYPNALTQLEEAVRLREDPDYLVNYGVVLRELKRFPASQDALERAVAVDPDNSLALNNLGITHFMAGNMEDARRAFTRVTSITPADPTARSFLAKIGSTPPTGAKKIEPVKAESPKTSKKPEKEMFPDRETQSDVERLRRENKDLQTRIEQMEKKMDDIRKGVVTQMAEDEKAQAARVNTALKKAEQKLEKKEKELASEPPAKRPADRPAGSIPEPLEDRLSELQRTLSEARMELESVRHQSGGLVFSPEPGSTEDRLDAADRTVNQLQRQISQLSTERDMLKSEIAAIRPSGASPASDFGRTNVNLADLNALLLVPGMEERLAHNILWYRQNIGPFRSVMDLKKVPGMDDMHYAKMVDFISVGAEAAQ